MVGLDLEKAPKVASPGDDKVVMTALTGVFCRSRSAAGINSANSARLFFLHVSQVQVSTTVFIEASFNCQRT